MTAPPRHRPALPPEDFPAFMQHLQRTDFLAFLEGAFDILHPGQRLKLGLPHHAIAYALAEIENGKVRRQIINMPPRSLKSEMISVAWVAFTLGRDPLMKFMCVSYSEELGRKLTHDCAKIMRSPWFKALFPECKLIINRADWLETSLGGVRYSVPLGGQITGFGAHVIILDDPMKPQDATSEVQRQAVLEAYRNTLSSRLDDKTRGVIVLIMQRLHADDLSSELESRGGWSCLKLPAEAQEDLRVPVGPGRTKLLRRGQLLHPERDTREALAQQRQEMGANNYAAQYLQEPVVAHGAMLKASWFATSPANLQVKAGDYIVQSWDCASKLGVLNDYSVCITALVRKGAVHILHVMREKLEFPDLKKKAVTLAKEHRAKLILIEDAASGQQLIQSLNHELGTGEIRGMPPPIGIRPTQDKVTRMAGVTPLMEAGKFFLPADADWLAAFRKELLAFPDSLHDDQADALSQLLTRLREQPPIPNVLPGVNLKAPGPWDTWDLSDAGGTPESFEEYFVYR